MAEDEEETEGFSTGFWWEVRKVFEPTLSFLQEEGDQRRSKLFKSFPRCSRTSRTQFLNFSPFLGSLPRVPFSLTVPLPFFSSFLSFLFRFIFLSLSFSLFLYPFPFHFPLDVRYLEKDPTNSQGNRRGNRRSTVNAPFLFVLLLGRRLTPVVGRAIFSNRTN